MIIDVEKIKVGGKISSVLGTIHCKALHSNKLALETCFFCSDVNEKAAPPSSILRREIKAAELFFSAFDPKHFLQQVAEPVLTIALCIPSREQLRRRRSVWGFGTHGVHSLLEQTRPHTGGLSFVYLFSDSKTTEEETRGVHLPPFFAHCTFLGNGLEQLEQGRSRLLPIG